MGRLIDQKESCMKITKLRFGIVTAADRVDLSIKSSGKLEVGGGCLLGVGVRGCPKMMALGVAWVFVGLRRLKASTVADSGSKIPKS
jgi:hypothetical protein